MLAETQPLDFLTLPEVISSLKISRDTALRMLKRGDFPAYKVGRGWRIPRQAILSWLENNKHQPS